MFTSLRPVDVCKEAAAAMPVASNHVLPTNANLLAQLIIPPYNGVVMIA
jgi:hypothetical protein